MINLSGQREHKDILDLVMFGLFLLLIGVMFIKTPDLIDKGYRFFLDLEFREPYSYIYLPVPKSDHRLFFTTISQFCLAFAILHIPILGARFILKDPAEKKGGTISGLIFWFGTAWVINQLIIKEINWLTFLGYLIALIGVTMVIKNAIFLATRPFRK